jgi:hypothetical protein
MPCYYMRFQFNEKWNLIFFTNIYMPVPVAVRLLRSWIRIPPGAWMFVCCEWCVLSGRDLCDELITRPE